MTPAEIRLKCLEQAVLTTKGRSVTNPKETVLEIAKDFEHYVTEEVNQKSVNLNKGSKPTRKTSTR